MPLSRPDYTGASVSLLYDPDADIYIDATPDFLHSRLRSYLIMSVSGTYHNLFTLDCRALLKSLVCRAANPGFTTAFFRWVPTTGTARIMETAGPLHAYGITDASKGPVYAPKIDADADLYSMGINDLLIPADGGSLEIRQGSGANFDILYDYILYSEKP